MMRPPYLRVIRTGPALGAADRDTGRAAGRVPVDLPAEEATRVVAFALLGR